MKSVTFRHFPAVISPHSKQAVGALGELGLHAARAPHQVLLSGQQRRAEVGFDARGESGRVRQAEGLLPQGAAYSRREGSLRRAAQRQDAAGAAEIAA